MVNVSHIVEWQKAISPDHDTDTDEPLVANLYKACADLYSGLLKELAGDSCIDKAVLVGLERSHSYLVLWDDGYSVSDGSLDAALDNSHRAKRSTLRLLFSICQILTKRLLKVLSKDKQALLVDKAVAVTHASEKLKYLAHQDGTADSDSDTSSETSSTAGDSELEEIAEDLKTDAECLLDLGSRFNEKTVGPLINESAVDPELFGAWDPSKNFIDRIRWRYPQCGSKLAERLGSANWARVLRYQEKKANARLQATEPQTTVAKAATLKGSTGASTSFHDSALGSSVPTVPSQSAELAPAPSVYAETVVSYRGGQGESVRVPGLPDGAANSVPFVCVGCGEMVIITSKSEWKKHLFLDLQPYVCVLDCRYTTAPFPTKNEWERHVVAEHDLGSDSFTCPICQEKSEPKQARAHLARHLEEIALTVLPTNPDSEDGTDVDSGLASSETSSQADEDLATRTQNTSPITDTVDRIQTALLDPILKRDDLKAFHETVLQIREGMHVGMVLRDVEIALILNAQKSAPTLAHFQRFGLLVLAIIESIIPQFEESAMIRPDEQPYDEEYFADAKKRVRRTVRQINDAEAQKVTPSDKGSNGDGADDDEEEILRALARRKRDGHFLEYKTCREPGCNKQFKRPCDLRKHEKAHSRSWKCPLPTCKYHEFGWPTKKELDRHVADKHSEEPAMFECQFQPCSYKSKRESHCKQHMEKIHGWTYVRSKTTGRITMTAVTPASLTERESSTYLPQRAIPKQLNTFDNDDDHLHKPISSRYMTPADSHADSATEKLNFIGGSALRELRASQALFPTEPTNAVPDSLEYHSSLPDSRHWQAIMGGPHAATEEQHIENTRAYRYYPGTYDLGTLEPPPLRLPAPVVTESAHPQRGETMMPHHMSMAGSGPKSPYVGMPEDFMAFLFRPGTPSDGPATVGSGPYFGSNELNEPQFAGFSENHTTWQQGLVTPSDRPGSPISQAMPSHYSNYNGLQTSQYSVSDLNSDGTIPYPDPAATLSSHTEGDIISEPPSGK